ncbi:iron-containing alcohol dehydrogenase [Pseudonocardia sp. ICBG1293]|uniref:iron-containing alcohol dehydrogenase n=1 Tax=Pseudonocardia sp. ICBG1293 TaxID=2844382 RepID=UPI001CCFEBE9|nr:iron-containing alcohol dehydrogenase [Pseudonocardia sp. ICBG1293]
MTAVGPGTRVLALRGADRLHRLHDVLSGGRAFVVAAPTALRRAGVADLLPAGTATFSAFTPNPTTQQALAAARARERHGAGVVVGIGGGSAMDVAKAARALPGDADAAAAVLARRTRPAADRPRLVLVPTTAGTGSEVTSFATLYDGPRKLSLDDDRVRAEVAAVDPGLLATCPAAVLWSGALDTVAHAIESLWSVRSGPGSRSDAVRALERIAPVLGDPAAVGRPDGWAALSDAGTLAGRAIDRTRTTAAHALAYPLTAHLGFPHGYAVAVTLRWLVAVVEAGGDAVCDPRGRAVPRSAVAAAADALGVDGGAGVAALLDRVLARCDVAGVPARRVEPLLDRLVGEGLASERVGGTPVHLSPEQVRVRLRRSLAELRERAEPGA